VYSDGQHITAFGFLPIGLLAAFVSLGSPAMALFDNKNVGETASPTASYRDEDFQRIDPESGVKRGELLYTIGHS
jgi:hypothetical protein